MGVRALMVGWVLCWGGCSVPHHEISTATGRERIPDDTGHPLPPDPLPPGRGTDTLPTCTTDADCGYDPSRGACGNDPRYNRQPLLIDQGILCYCEEHRCATLKVSPVPCESNASCAVRADPRPHPVAASAAFPHERGKPCKDYRISTTCERTNICTMHRHPCPGP